MGAVSVNGITVGYDDVGRGEDVLVLVHGHPFDRSMWRPQVEKIARQANFAKASAVAKADISLAVIHDRAKRPCTAKRSEVVNNCAASHNRAGG